LLGCQVGPQLGSRANDTTSGWRDSDIAGRSAPASVCGAWRRKDVVYTHDRDRDGERWTSTRFPSTIQTSQTQELGFRRFAASSIRPTIAFRQHSRHRIDAGASPVDTLGLTGVSLGARWANARKRSRLYGGSIGYSLPTGVRPMRLNQETLGRVRAVLFGIVFALVLIAYALHRLHL